MYRDMVYLSDFSMVLNFVLFHFKYGYLCDTDILTYILFTRLAFPAEDPGSIPGAGSHCPHIIYLFIVYIHRIHHRPADGNVKWRSHVSELYSWQVKEPGWLWWNSMSLCIRFPSLLSSHCTHDKCVNIIT